MTPMIERQHFVTDLSEFNGERAACSEGEANLVSSHVTGYGAGMLHAPVIDLDFPCWLEPSTTPGHFHLYLDRVITWERYVQLLNALRDAGLIEDGFHRMSLHRGATFVRKPGVAKRATDSNSTGGTTV